MSDDNRSLRDRIYASLKDYWPNPTDPFERKQIRNCRDQIVADVKDWLVLSNE